MKKFIPYTLLVLTTIIFTASIISDENKIIDLEKQLYQQSNSIDSLNSKIDTLQWELEIIDYRIDENPTDLISSIIHIESSNNDSAHNLREDAVGCLQIRKCMVDDVNRILQKQKLSQRFTYDDRWNRYKSLQMFEVYCEYYNLNTNEERARSWNGGPRGMNNPSTVQYWGKVENHLNS
tara:strand:- start:769 stop:1305 length:537 start_codon:yes stop_codon:yes gene_type:complete